MISRAHSALDRILARLESLQGNNNGVIEPFHHRTRKMSERPSNTEENQGEKLQTAQHVVAVKKPV